MKRLLPILALAPCLSAAAQVPVNAPAAASSNPLVAEARQAYNQIKTNLQNMAAKMPPESYDFKPVPEIRTFGELMAHIADFQTRTCSPLHGQARSGDAASKKTKDDLVAALKASFDECDAAWDATTEANAFEMTGGGRMQRSRLGTLINNTYHNNEEYGYGAVYLRLKGIVPPSSEGGGMRGGMGGRGGR